MYEDCDFVYFAGLQAETEKQKSSRLLLPHLFKNYDFSGDFPAILANETELEKKVALIATESRLPPAVDVELCQEDIVHQRRRRPAPLPCQPEVRALPSWCAAGLGR